jgi:hypothetical protein
MALIQVRDVPEQIYRRLVAAAEREHRSLAQQVVATLAVGLDVQVDSKTRRRRVIETAIGAECDTDKRLTDPARILREDRRR